MAASAKRVLVVDDEPGLADVVADHLRRIDGGLSVQTATTASDGLALVRDGPAFGCVVSDYNMPEMNGLELLEAVREEYPSLPFILYTGRGSEEIASEAISAGVTDYVQKGSGPDHYEVLTKRIQNAIAQRRTEAELRRTQEKIEALHQTAAKAATCSGRTELCRLAVAAAEEILEFDLCDISLREGPRLVPQAVSKGVPSDGYYRSTRMDDDDSFAAQVFRGEESVRIDDLRSHEAAPAEPNYRSVMTIPIDDHGVFQAVSRDVEGFDDRDQELAELLLAHVGAALDRMESEARLREERDKFAALFRNIPQAVAIRSLDGQEAVAHEVNPAFEAVFGWDADDLAGRSVDDRIVPEGDESEAAAINERLRNGERISGKEVRRVTEDGLRDFLLHTVTTPTDDAAGFVIYTDITDQKRRERELQRQNERLDEFASVLGHDLRNPLEVADGNARLLAEDCDSDRTGPLLTALTRIEERVDEALELAEQGQTVREPTAVSVPSVVEDAWEMVDTDDATLTVGELPEEISGDPARLRRLFENLFDNAVEHGSTSNRPEADDARQHGGPALTVEVGSLDCERGVYVADDGPGVGGDHDRLFERGYTESESGSGLGLRIVEDVARAHGWSVRATEAEAGGLRVEMDFQRVQS
ncbi:hybrid sensor histidine kinase/response regulator [Halorussus litoreus]|uniref:hybrid sensor histidine kinase/response regulator n=1 Tax=Halorussus litoreus TaxID=1710536 RepID=UPI000E24A878|nr:response regulator [Halorussus litoreus]